MSAPVIHHQQNRVMRRFHAAGATSPEQALPPASIGVRRSMVFQYLESRGVIKSVDANRFFLDEQAEKDFRRRRFRFTIAILAAAALVMLAILVAVLIGGT